MPGEPHAGPDPTAPVTWRMSWAGAALGAAVVALVVRFILAGDASWTYNEATYVELARHPWWSSFYPDTVFLRHPPLAFLALALWTAVFGEGEWVVRLLALLVTLGAVVLLWDAARRGGAEKAAVLVAVVLAAAYPLHAYALQASMYPFAFLAAAAAVWYHVRGDVRGEGWALAAFALTHLFGFLFLALWAWRNRKDLQHHWLPVALPALWLVGSALVALVFNAEGDIMRLGPIGQVLRSGSTAEKAVAVSPLIHVTSALLAVWTLVPPLLVAGWRLRKRFVAWTIGVVLLIPYFFVAAPFPRYALLVLPFSLVVGALAVTERKAPVAVVLALVVAASSIPVGFAYLEHGPDPRAAGDVPGVQDWASAVAALPDNASLILTSGPTATAFYLGERGAEVVNRTEAPYRIVLGQEGSVRVVQRLDAPADVEPTMGDAWIVPSHWTDMRGRLPSDAERCAAPRGLFVYALAC